MRDTILEGVSPEGINERIVECNELDRISQLFYQRLIETDSLIKLTQISELIKADSLFKLVEGLGYKPGEAKLKSIKGTYQIQLNNVIGDQLRIAEMQISAGVRDDAYSTIRKLELLIPDNELIENFKKANNIKTKTDEN